jgi:hypothetical protein
LCQLVDHFISLCPCRRAASIRSRSTPAAQ